MKKFIVEKSFWDLFPEAKLGVILLKNINNNFDNEEFKKELKKANNEAKKYLTSSILSEIEEVKVWREAYKKFKNKKGARSSIEALLKRVEQEKYVSSINPLVDIYNAASLKFALPCGAEDIDKFVGNLKLEVTSGNDEFLALGDEEVSYTYEGEVCYKDDAGAVCRCLNWRDGKRTMIDENTKNAFLIMELLDLNRFSVLKEALEYIKKQASEYLNAEIELKILDKDDFEINL
ncbi:B3/4 domain-containing protein [Mycoplasma struthionis]|uniref:B3/B4 tRNA-binding domain-containing protein n=1 Tax=Mycoplasma struthionis TaxID=538220 RepID=A0A502M8C7_9MOLU|nr:B3/4 domain-containing protein [Mycoplasma struthionis]TPI01133.1 hypothetical protein FJM01_02855 [Mycoplasma struthionis]